MAISKDRLLEELDRQEKAAVQGTSQNLFDKALKDVADEDDQVVDILTYVTSPWGLKETPFPVQTFILKLIFGLPLDDKNKTIQTWDRFKEHLLGEYTEKEFLDFLHKNERCNISSADHEAKLGDIRTTVLLRMGRRGGKTTIGQWIAAYLTYKLLKMKWPQEYYSMKQDQRISITLIATGKEQAQKLLAPTRASIQRSPFLRQYVCDDSMQKITLNTRKNKELGLGPESGIMVTAAPCSAKSIRGEANLLVLLEEFGFFYKELEGSNKSDSSIYQAASPSTSDYKNPKTGKLESILMIVSTPLTKESYMYTVEKNILDGEMSGGLFLWLPSYWANPQLSTERLRDDFVNDVMLFRQEYEAEYMDQLEAAFTKPQIEEITCDPGAEMNMIFPGETTWMGVDLGLKHDGTSISIVAVNDEGNARLIHHEQHRAGLPPYEAQQELDIQRIAERIDYLWNYYGCAGGIYDQWNAYGLKSHMQSRAKEMMEHVEFNPTNNDRVARHFAAMVQQKRLTLYAESHVWDDQESLQREIVRLHRRVTGGDPPKIKYQAPNVRGFHDDQYSSLSRALWAAKQGMEDMPPPSSGRTNPGHAQVVRSMRDRAEALRRQAKNFSERSVQRGDFRRRSRW